MKYLLLPVLLLATAALGTAATVPEATPAPSAATAAWAIPVNLLKEAFPGIYGGMRSTTAPPEMDLDFGIHVPLLTGLQVLKAALEAPASGAAGDVSLIVCQVNSGTTAAPYVLNCESNAQMLHERKSVTVPNVPPECANANLSAADIERTYREGIVPYTVANYFNFANVNPAALKQLVQGIPEPSAALCPIVRQTH